MLSCHWRVRGGALSAEAPLTRGPRGKKKERERKRKREGLIDWFYSVLSVYKLQ